MTAEKSQSDEVRSSFISIYRLLMRISYLACRSFKRLPNVRSQLYHPPILSKFQARTATYVLPKATTLGDMGKDKVAYLLKTPKGTKDCTVNIKKPTVLAESNL